MNSAAAAQVVAIFATGAPLGEAAERLYFKRHADPSLVHYMVASLLKTVKQLSAEDELLAKMDLTPS